MSDDNKPENGKIRLVVENDPSQIALNVAQDEAARALAKMVTNLLRVIAGGGNQSHVMPDMHKALMTWQEFTEQTGRHYLAPGLDDLGFRLIKSTIPVRLRGRQRQDSFARACRIG